MTSIPAGLLEGPAREVFNGIVGFYDVKPHALLRAIIEVVLDQLSEDGDLQRQYAEAAKQVEVYGHVPDCWLNLEGGSDEAEEDDPAGGDDADDDLSDDGDEDMDTNERHEHVKRVRPIYVYNPQAEDWEWEWVEKRKKSLVARVDDDDIPF